MERLKQLTEDIINEIKTFNFLVQDNDEFVLSIPIAYWGKLYYQTLYVDKSTNNYLLKPPTFVNQIQKGEAIYEFIYNKYLPNKIMNSKEVYQYKLKVAKIIRDLKKYNWFDMCVCVRQCHIIKVIPSKQFKIDYNDQGEITIHTNLQPKGKSKPNIMNFFKEV